jgi:hypothetical protein
VVSKSAVGTDQLRTAVVQEDGREHHLARTTQSHPAERTTDSSHDDRGGRLHRSVESLYLQEPVDSCLVTLRLAQRQKNLRLDVLAVGTATEDVMAGNPRADVAATGYGNSARGVHRDLPTGGRRLR